MFDDTRAIIFAMRARGRSIAARHETSNNRFDTRVCSLARAINNYNAAERGRFDGRVELAVKSAVTTAAIAVVVERPLLKCPGNARTSASVNAAERKKASRQHGEINLLTGA